LTDPDGSLAVPASFCRFRVLSAFVSRLVLALPQAGLSTRQLQFGGSLEDLSERPHSNRLLKNARKKKWVVYAKRPLRASASADIFGRYTHRVALYTIVCRARKRKSHFQLECYRDFRRVQDMSIEAGEFTDDSSQCCPMAFRRSATSGLWLMGRAANLRTVPQAHPRLCASRSRSRGERLDRAL